ncbi:MAG: NUDIX domain-containing protein [Prolixibacteraceae bacterium]|jgi:8-oxo-dGTP diphosphatase|nr:NUDIX domain-containing protein [Prolixibacteraceae bacterium]
MNFENTIEGLSIDTVIFGFEDNELKVLLFKRIEDKNNDNWAIPGGFIQYNEDIDSAADRILKERTGVSVYMRQLHAFGKINRFPDRRIVTIAYFALIKPGNYHLTLADDITDIQWKNIYELPPLCFDHSEIIKSALKILRIRIRIEPIGFNLLPNEFPLYSLQVLYESILNAKFDKSNFRRKILRMKLLISLDAKQESVAHRSARLYKFDVDRYKRLQEKGFNFEM